MSTTRKAIPLATRRLVLHESGYRCAVPVCRTILTLEIHHLEYVSERGSNDASNLLPLCPNCHALEQQGVISKDSLRSWKMLLLSLNEAFDKRSLDFLLALDKIEDGLFVSGEGVLTCSSLVASDMITVEQIVQEGIRELDVTYHISFTAKGRSFVKAWKAGDQNAAVSRTT
ncbi:MAG TPA: HNH endonuclease signature motif containing protein [Candidatus Kryptonia bacterium]